MKISILFTIKDINIIQDLRRAMHERMEWNTYFAEEGEAALRVLAENEVDVVVLDMRLPGVDGLELLKKIRERYPLVIRMVLSAYADQEAILRSATLAHQFFAKPCHPEVLMSAIEDVWLLRDLISNERLKNLIAGVTDLPSLPSVYIRLMDYMQTSNASIKKIGEIISQDMTMTAQVLHLVNSAFFSLTQKVVDPSRAVSLLGIENLKALLLYIHFFSIFDSKRLQPVISGLWRHSTIVGRLAREIAIMESADRATVENALATGILHDIGKLVLVSITGNKIAAPQDEYALFGATHSEVGAYLLGLWAMPASIVKGVVFHHHPVLSGEEEFTALTAVHVADALASSTTTDSSEIPGLAYDYLRIINKVDRLSQWAACYERINLNQAQSSQFPGSVA